MKRESFRPTLLAGVLIVLAAGLTFAQDKPAARNSDTVRRAVSQLEATDVADKPSAIQLIHKRTLLSSYGKFQDSLKGDIVTLEKMLAAADSADADTRTEIAQQIAHLNGERNDLASKIQRLRAELMSSAAAAAPPRERDAADGQPVPEIRNAVYRFDSNSSKASSEHLSEGRAPESIRAHATANAEPVPSAQEAFDVVVTNRTADSATLSVTIPPTARSIRIKVKDKATGTESFSEDYPVQEGDKLLTLTVHGITKGENTITVSTTRGLLAKEFPIVALGDETARSLDRRSEAPEYDWGRVRGYFASGVMFSKERGNFSKSDIFLSFTLDKNYLNKAWGPFQDVNTYFSAQLAAVPVTTATPAPTAPAAGATPTPTPCNTADCESFVSSQKAALLQAGVYLPMYGKFMMWKREVPNVRGTTRTEDNALFIAPLAQGGIVTITDNRVTAEAEAFGKDDVFNFFSLGLRLGHFRTHLIQNDDEARHLKRGDQDRNIAPELISWLDLGYGRYEMFEINEKVKDSAGRVLKDLAGNDISVRRRPWRWNASGRLRVPETPFMIGFDGNFGKGPDDLRFIFGTRFDIGKVLRTIRVANANDTLGRNTQ